MKNTAITAITLSMLLSVSVLGQPNLIVNGDFESGNTDFTTDYIYVPPPLNEHSLRPEGVYSVDTDPHNGHTKFWSFGDHTTGLGNMLIANGHPEADKHVWEQTIAVLPNAVYVLTYYVSSCVPGNPATIKCSVNGISLGSAGAPTPPGTWTEVSYFWNSGASTSAAIALEDLNIVRGGNDYVIDDISFCCTKIEVLIDIKPETLNLQSKGLFTAFIELPEGYGKEDVDIGTVECEAAPAVSGVMADDGRLIVKFDRQDLQDVPTGDAVKLTVTGKLSNGTAFAGSDTIRVIDKGGKKK